MIEPQMWAEFVCGALPEGKLTPDDAKLFLRLLIADVRAHDALGELPTAELFTAWQGLVSGLSIEPTNFVMYRKALYE